MKKIFAIVFFISAMCSFIFAQTPLSALEKAKKIKLLESTREDVKRIFNDFKADEDADDFSAHNIGIDIYYTEGNCSDDESEEMWNVPEGRVKHIIIRFYEREDEEKKLNIEDFKYNTSNLQKEQEYWNLENQYVYSNKSFGIAFTVDEDGVQSITLVPSKSYQSMSCKSEVAKEYFSSKSWFGKIKLKDRWFNYGNIPPNVTDLKLGATEIIVGCKDSAKSASCPYTNWEISVKTTAVEPENDVITYEYKITGGKVVGSGAEIIWDLSGVTPGEYTITAGANDGCGICGQTMTKTVVVKECPDCSVKDN